MLFLTGVAGLLRTSLRRKCCEILTKKKQKTKGSYTSDESLLTSIAPGGFLLIFEELWLQSGQALAKSESKSRKPTQKRR